MRRVFAVVIDGVDGDGEPPVRIEWFAGVGVDIEAGKIAARDVKPDPMPFNEEI